MASLRVTLTDESMDIVMCLVRQYDKNPSEVINMVISNPQLIYDARSEIDERKSKGEKQV